MQVIQDFECCFVALLRLLNGFCFGDALLRVGQVAFSGRYCFRCGFKLFPLYEFDGGVAEALSTVYLVARIPKTVACRISQPAKAPRRPDTKITFVIPPSRLNPPVETRLAPSGLGPTHFGRTRSSSVSTGKNRPSALPGIVSRPRP